MDSAWRPFLLLALVAFLHGLLAAWWQRFEAAEAGKPIPMKLRNGVYVPWGRVERIQRWIDRLFVAWLVYTALLLVAVAFA